MNKCWSLECTVVTYWTLDRCVFKVAACQIYAHTRVGLLYNMVLSPNLERSKKKLGGTSNPSKGTKSDISGHISTAVHPCVED